MAKKGGPKKGADKGKQQVKKEGKRLSALYNISGDSIERKNRNCPKCGPGTFLGKHKDRIVCGKCQYVEYVKKEVKKEVTESKDSESSDKPAETKKE
jgi:ubiquitin-small subunit ribosomal protein S27Ae